MAMIKRRRRRRTQVKKGVESLLPANDLNAVSRAQLGRDEKRLPHRPLPDDASVEDPLQDWPEDS